MDQTNSLRNLVEDDGVGIGAKAGTFHPAVVETYGDVGLDFVWLDFEHGGSSPWDSTVLETLTRAAEVGRTELIVRIPIPEPALVRKVLDAGVRNVLIPRVDDAADVRRAVAATRFEYDGRPGERGSASGRSAGYGSRDDEYVETEDANVMAGVMIEKQTAYENLDEILSVPDLGFAFIGTGDLSVQLGHPGERDHPRVRETIEDIEQRVSASDVALAGICGSATDTSEMIERGYEIVRIGGDISAIRSTLADRIDHIDR